MKRVLPLLMMIVFSWPSYGVLSSYISGANREKLMEGEENPESIELYEPLELDQDGDTLLMLLLQQEMFARVVLEIGIDINHQDKDGETALMYAVCRGEIKNVELLIKHGADLNLGNKYQMTALMMSAEREYDHGAITELLLKNGADVNAQDQLGRTALMIAVIEGNYATMKILLDHGADMHLMTRRLDPFRIRKGSLAYKEYLRWRDAPVLVGGTVGMPSFIGLFPPLGGYTALMEAARRGDKSSIRILMERGVDIHQQNRDGKTAYDVLHYGDLDEVEREWEKAGMVRWRDYLSSFPGERMQPYPKERKYAPYKDYLSPKAPMLMKSVGNPEEMKKILERGVNVNYRDIEGCTTLMYCVQEATAREGSPEWRDSCRECVSILIEHGANIYMVDNEGWTALMMGVQDTESLEMLLKAGAEVDVVDMEGQTALMKAVSNKRGVELLIKYGADVMRMDQQWKTALMYALDNPESVEELIRHGSKLNHRDKEGKTALYLCVEQVYKGERALDEEEWRVYDQTLNILLKNGADVNTQDRHKQTPLMLVSQDKPSVEKLLKYGAKVNVSDDQGYTPLMYSFMDYERGRDLLGSIALILEHGADVNVRNALGQTASMRILPWQSNEGGTEKRLKILDMLVKHGADLNVMSNGHSQEYQKEQTQKDLVWPLLRGYTVLMDAIGDQRVDVVKQLLKYGVDVEIQNRDGYTACDVAVHQRNRARTKEERQKAEEIIKLLREAGATYRADINDAPPADRKSKPYKD